MSHITKKDQTLVKKLMKNEKNETRKEEKKETPKEQRLERKYKIEEHEQPKTKTKLSKSKK